MDASTLELLAIDTQICTCSRVGEVPCFPCLVRSVVLCVLPVPCVCVCLVPGAWGGGRGRGKVGGECRQKRGSVDRGRARLRLLRSGRSGAQQNGRCASGLYVHLVEVLSRALCLG